MSDLKKSLILRSFLFLFVLITCAYCTFFLKDTFLYFCKIFEDPVELGDLREKRASGLTDLNLKDNSYVRFAHALITKESEAKYYYFYCPLYHFIVKTKKPVPERSTRVKNTEIPEGLLYLFKTRQVMPEDFSVSFSGEGRLIDLSKHAEDYKNIINFYNQAIKHAEHETIYLFIDGDTPVSNYMYFIACLGAFLGVFFSGILLIVTYRRWKRNVTKFS